MPPIPATGEPSLSSAATRLLATITARPGLHSPRQWALLHGWDERETSDAYRELVAARMARPLGIVRWRLGPRSEGIRGWAYRDLPNLPAARMTSRDWTDRLVAMAWGDGWDRVADIARETGRDEATVQRSVRRLARRGHVWPLGACVPA